VHIVVTGGAGFIGSHLAERLVGAGHTVLLYDSFNKQYAPVIKRRNVAAALSLPGCSLIEGDVLESQRFESVFSAHAVDAVVHLAAAIAPPGPDAAKTIVETNLVGTQFVLERCRRHGVKKLVLLSTAGVYGSCENRPCRETDPTDRQLSIYAASKKMAETLAWLAHHQHGLDVFVLRPFSVYGPRQRPDQAIHRIARAVLAGEAVELPGDGSSTLDLVAVGDVVEAITKAVEAVQGFAVMNVGTGRPTTMARLVERIAAALGSSPEVRHGPADPTLPVYAVADTTVAEKLLGWRAATDLDEGLKRFINWVRAEEFADEA
jgi:UDP-glucuronate 4-epimerase